MYKSKNVYTTSEKQQVIEQSAASYSVDASEMHSWVVSSDDAAAPGSSPGNSIQRDARGEDGGHGRRGGSKTGGKSGRW